MNVKRGRAEADLVEALLRELPDLFAVTARLSELVADRLGMAATDVECLHFLHEHGPASPGELARRVGRTTGAVTRMLDRLERAGFVERSRTTTDRRGVRVTATPAGIDRVAGHFEELADRTRAELAGHDAHDLQVLLVFVRTSTAGTTDQMRRLIDGP